MYYAKFDAQGERVTSIVEGVHFIDVDSLQPYLDDGFVEISDEEQEIYATNDYVRDVKTGEPILRPPFIPLIAELAENTWQATKTARDATEQAGCPYMGKVLDSDQTSVQRISIAVQAAQGALTAGTKGFVLDWTMQDNTVIAMNAEQVIGMSAALAAHSNQIHEQARAIRKQIRQIVVDFEAGTLAEDTARSALSAIKFKV